MTVNPLDLFSSKPAFDNYSIRLEKGLTVHYRHDLPGALDAPQGLSHHLLTFFLSTNERQVTHIDGGGEYDGQMNYGDFYLCPADRPGFTRWHSVDQTLHLVIEPDFLSKIAIDTESISPGSVELLPVLKNCDRKLEHLVQLFLAELGSRELGETLYLESLSSMLGIHLLRQYCTATPQIRRFSEGLASYKLNVVLEYIQTHLNTELSLDAIAAQIDMSRYYFATQFKQAMGLAPHQYVNQQRIERAKQFLRAQKLPLAEVALECGFSSQSHLTKVFKQQTGVTPKAYRNQLASRRR